MLAFADYFPELWRPPTKTATQQWHEKLEGMPVQYEDGYEQYAQEFHRGDRYRTESEVPDDREDGMIWN
jgi:hypothetical protein